MFLFKSGRLLDPRKGELIDNVDVLVNGATIREVSTQPLTSPSANVIALNGKIIMPGLIDCHVHVTASEVNSMFLADVPLTLMTARASVLARNMLMRGFTTVRDTGGADYGLRTALEEGLITGPRLFIAGAPISQTGGHGDWRRKTQHTLECACCSALAFKTRIADGVPEMIKAVRDELRKGVDHIKLFCSGGVSSQNDPLESVQFRTDEIEAACEEATRWGRYVAAHAYSTEAVRRAVQAGVRTIEHGNFIDRDTAKLMAEKGTWLVPTLVTYESMKRRGRELGMSEFSLGKNAAVLENGLRAIEICREAGVNIGFGTDLLGKLQEDQCREFLIRREILSTREIIQSATIMNARIIGQEGRVGEIVPGASADILIVDGNPLKGLGILQDQGKNMPLIMKAGAIVKDTLSH